jgi:hypothetical protein
MNMELQLWHIEQIRDKVEELEDEINVKIYSQDGVVYKIWYNPVARVALYARVIWDEQHKKERLVKAWPQQILKALNSKAVKIRVERRNDRRYVEWFDSTKDSNAVLNAYNYILSITKSPIESIWRMRKI